MHAHARWLLAQRTTDTASHVWRAQRCEPGRGQRGAVPPVEGAQQLLAQGGRLVGGGGALDARGGQLALQPRGALARRGRARRLALQPPQPRVQLAGAPAREGTLACGLEGSPHLQACQDQAARAWHSPETERYRGWEYRRSAASSARPAAAAASARAARPASAAAAACAAPSRRRADAASRCVCASCSCAAEVGHAVAPRS